MSRVANPERPSEKSPDPDVAVVIATRDRETRLAFALEGLAGQTLDRDRFEVIVVRAGGHGEPHATAPPGLRTRFIEHLGVPGAAAQRNLGWRATDAPLVAFIDDDSRPAPEWLEQLLGAAPTAEAVVQGRIEPDPDERHLLFGLARSHELIGPSPRFETGNIAYPRVLLERLGGFDESVRGNDWGEDTDLGLRARAGGAAFEYADDALVWHAVIPRTLREAVADARRYESLVRLIGRRPELRRELFPRGILKTSHVTVALAVGGTIAFRRRPLLAVAAAVPYFGIALRAHLDVNPPTFRRLARFAVHLPLAVVSDAAEVAVTLRAAARHRVPIV